MNIKLKRAYEPAEDTDGLRILVDRMWPRGIKKTDLPYDIWAKDVTPTIELRRFFHDNPYGNWEEFSRRYKEQLMHSEALDKLAAYIRDGHFNTVTLLYGFRNPIKNHAVVLRQALLERIQGTLLSPTP